MSGVDLSALAAEAAQLDNAANAAAEAAGAPADAPPERAPEPDYAAQLAMLLTMCMVALKPAYPLLPKHYTPEVCQQVARAWVELAQAYELDLSMLSGKLALWAQAVAVTGLPAMAIVAELRAIEAAREAAQDQAPAAPAQ